MNGILDGKYLMELYAYSRAVMRKSGERNALDDWRATIG